MNHLRLQRPFKKKSSISYTYGLVALLTQGTVFKATLKRQQILSCFCGADIKGKTEF